MIKIQSRRVRSAATAVAMLAGLLGAATATAPTASAEAAHCNSWFSQLINHPNYPSAYIKNPVYTWSGGISYYGCIMKYGDKGEAVKSLQENLRYCHNRTELAIDGSFGPATRNALTIVQGQIGAAQDGVWGAETAGKMHYAVWVSSARIGCTLP